jgi:hypothetical protein
VNQRLSAQTEVWEKNKDWLKGLKTLTQLGTTFKAGLTAGDGEPADAAATPTPVPAQTPFPQQSQQLQQPKPPQQQPQQPQQQQQQQLTPMVFKPSASSAPQAAVEIPLSQCSVRELLLRWKVCCRSCDRRPSRSILTVSTCIVALPMSMPCTDRRQVLERICC